MDLLVPIPSLLAWLAANPNVAKKLCRNTSSGVCSVATTKR